jgi:NAD(P)-dependent dehydrogenase (short-subunit alcohol dehydrogenase family)
VTRDGRRALVTGGASGFGLAIAQGLVEDGGQVALMDVSEPALAAAVRTLGDAASGHPGDVRDPAAVIEVVQAAAARMGGLDTLVVSAGVISVQPLGEVTEADWDRTLVHVPTGPGLGVEVDESVVRSYAFTEDDLVL